MSCGSGPYCKVRDLLAEVAAHRTLQLGVEAIKLIERLLCQLHRTTTANHDHVRVPTHAWCDLGAPLGRVDAKHGPPQVLRSGVPESDHGLECVYRPAAA